MNQVVRRLHDLGLGGTTKTIQDGIDLGDEYDKYERDTNNVELAAMDSQDLDSEIQRSLVQQHER